MGWPTRLLFSEFFSRYRVIGVKIPPGQKADKSGCQLICQLSNIDSNSYQCGLTRIFFRSGVVEVLELARSARLSKATVKLQKVIRGHQWGHQAHSPGSSCRLQRRALTFAAVAGVSAPMSSRRSLRVDRAGSPSTYPIAAVVPKLRRVHLEGGGRFVADRDLQLHSALNGPPGLRSLLEHRS